MEGHPLSTSSLSLGPRETLPFRSRKSGSGEEGQASSKAGRALAYCDLEQVLPSTVSATPKVHGRGSTPQTGGKLCQPPRSPLRLPTGQQFPWQPQQGPGGLTGRAANEQDPRMEASPDQATSGHLLVGLGRRILETWVGCLCTNPHQVANHKSDKSHVPARPQFPHLYHGNSPSSRRPLPGCHVGQR